MAEDNGGGDAAGVVVVAGNIQSKGEKKKERERARDKAEIRNEQQLEVCTPPPKRAGCNSSEEEEDKTRRRGLWCQKPALLEEKKGAEAERRSSHGLVAVLNRRDSSLDVRKECARALSFYLYLSLSLLTMVVRSL